MKDKELQEIVEENNTKFKLLISDKIFKIDEIKLFESENPVTAPTTRGGVYFSDLKEMKVQATISDTSVSKYLSNAMLGPNKTFLDILLEAEIKNELKISLVTNLTNTMQNSSKIILYFIIKNSRIKSI
ncbi:MAG: hypothetical protein QF559_00560 [Candidatus Nitrosopelagicus sp.]|jgi:hypothetical protein|nr:hypothetical protein [Candidatus Nitrosopelagicus sp.]